MTEAPPLGTVSTEALVDALRGREGVVVDTLSDDWHTINIQRPTVVVFIDEAVL